MDINIDCFLLFQRYFGVVRTGSEVPRGENLCAHLPCYVRYATKGISTSYMRYGGDYVPLWDTTVCPQMRHAVLPQDECVGEEGEEGEGCEFVINSLPELNWSDFSY